MIPALTRGQKDLIRDAKAQVNELIKAYNGDIKKESMSRFGNPSTKRAWYERNKLERVTGWPVWVRVQCVNADVAFINVLIDYEILRSYFRKLKGRSVTVEGVRFNGKWALRVEHRNDSGARGGITIQGIAGQLFVLLQPQQLPGIDLTSLSKAA